MKSLESQKAFSPLRLLRRADGTYSRKSEQGEEVLVSKKPDGSWDLYQNGSSEILGIWRDTPQVEPPSRNRFLQMLGFKKPVTKTAEAPSKIDPGQVRELFFVDNDIQGREVYRQVALPEPPKSKPWRAKHYEVALNIDPERNEVFSRSRITGYGTAASSSIPVDLGGFATSMMVVDQNGQQREFQRTADGVLVNRQLSPNDEFTVELSYQGRPQAVSHPGVPADLGWLANDSSVVTFNGAAPSSSWLPGDDDPSNKATYEFHILVPQNHFAVANGRLVEERRLPNGQRMFRYRTGFPMASYLASVNTFDERKFTRTLVAPDFEVVHPKHMEQQVRSEFKNHTRMMGFLEHRLGPYPFDVYGAIVTDLPVDSYKTRFTDGENTYEADSKFEVAFEAQTRPIFQADSITGTGEFEPTIIHELTHQWWGNAVTMANQQDVWVNEGFPSYSGWVWLEEINSPEMFEGEMKAMHESVKGHRFSDTMANPNRDKLFSQENYARMTLSMHALRRTLGDEIFYKTLRESFEEHKYKSVDVQTLAHTMNWLNGGTLSGFFQRWLHERELPAYPTR